MTKQLKGRIKQPTYETKRNGLTSRLPGIGTAGASTAATFVPEFFVQPKVCVASVADTLLRIQATWSTCEADGSTCVVTASIRLYRTGDAAQMYDGHIRWEILQTPAIGSAIIEKRNSAKKGQ